MGSKIAIFLVLLQVLVFVTKAQGSPLIDAVKKDDPTGIMNAISNGADMNEIVPFVGQTPLLLAVSLDKLDAAKTLLDLHADFTIPDKNSGWTIFHVAALKGRHRMVELLGGYQEVREQLIMAQHPEDGYYPMHRVCLKAKASGEDAKTVVAFMDLGVPFDLKAADGKTCRDMTQSAIIKYALLHAEAEQAEGAGDEL